MKMFGWTRTTKLEKSLLARNEELNQLVGSMAESLKTKDLPREIFGEHQRQIVRLTSEKEAREAGVEQQIYINESLRHKLAIARSDLEEANGVISELRSMVMELERELKQKENANVLEPVVKDGTGTQSAVDQASGGPE